MTPFSYITTIINSIIIGLLFYLNFNKSSGLNYNLYLLLLLISLTLIIVFRWGLVITLLSLISLLLVQIFCKYINISHKNLIRLTLSVMIISLFSFSLFDSQELMPYLKNPPKPPYLTDMAAYLNTYISLENNQNYYQAFAHDIKLRLNGNSPEELWGWKQPLIFYLWSALTSQAKGVLFLVAGFFSLNLICIHFFAKKYLKPELALLSAFLILPYFHYPLTEMTLFQVEWWALSVFIWGLAAYTYNKKLLAGILFALTLGIRELFVIPIISLFLIKLLKKKFRSLIILSLPTILIFIPYYLLIHVRNVLNFEDKTTLIASLLRHQAASGWQFVRPTLAYGSWSYALGELRIFLILLIINTLALSYLILKNKLRSKYLLLLAIYLPFSIVI